MVGQAYMMENIKAAHLNYCYELRIGSPDDEMNLSTEAVVKTQNIY